jgi:hexosaminidase
VIGVQGNVWTEYLKTARAVEYMVWPRALALAEVAWTPVDRRAWGGFASRVPARLRALERLGVHYRVPHVEGLEHDRLTLDDSVTVALRTLLPEARIHYTLDGSDPTTTSPRYERPLRLAVSAAGVRVSARAITLAGAQSPPRAATISRATLRAADPVSADTLARGLRVRYVEGTMSRVARLDSLPVAREGVATSIDLEAAGGRAEHFALRFDGWIRVPRDGIWTFTLTSDDGSVLAIGDRVVVDHDGPHGTESRSGAIALAAGFHPLTLRFFQGGGGKSLSLAWRLGEGAEEPIPATALFSARTPR